MRTSTFSPDGKWLVTASSDNWIRIWDFEKMQQIIKGTTFPDLLNASGKRTQIPPSQLVENMLSELERNNSVSDLILNELRVKK